MLSFDFLKKHLMMDLSDFMSSYAQEMSNSSKMSEMSNYEGNQEQNDENMTLYIIVKCHFMRGKMSHSPKYVGLVDGGDWYLVETICP